MSQQIEVQDFSKNNCTQKSTREATAGFFADVYGSCVNSLASQANGFVQLSNKLLGTGLNELKLVPVDNPESGWGAWSASLIGQSGAMAVELFVGQKLGGGARVLMGKESPAAVIAGSESASSKMYSSLAVGALRGGIFTPTDDPAHFWSDRLKNMTSSTVSVGTMTGISLSMERKAATLGGGFLKSSMSNSYINTGFGGFIGGGLGQITSSALNGKLPDSSSEYWKHVGTAGAEFALAGMGTSALGAAGSRLAAVHESAQLKSYPIVEDAVGKMHEQAAQSLPPGQVPEPGSWADPRAVEMLKKAALQQPALRMRSTVGPTRVNHSKDLIELRHGDDPLALLEETSHRRIFKDPVYEAKFKTLATKIRSPDPADPQNAAVKEEYVETRLDQEVAARTARNEAAEKLGVTRRVSVDRAEIRKDGYGARFEEEANEFIRTGGTTRPQFDYARDAIDYQTRIVNGIVERTFNNARMPGRDNNRFDQDDKTKVHFGYDNSGRITVDFFPSGRVHSVNLNESINQVRITAGNDGAVFYYFNGRSQPQLIVESALNQMKVALSNGDTVLITGVDHQGASLNFSDGSRAVLAGNGKLIVAAPGKATKSVALGTTPGRFAVVEKADGGKLFQIANDAATQQVQLNIDPPVAPTRVIYAPPDKVPTARVPLRGGRMPVPPRTERPAQIQGGNLGTPASQTYYSSDFPQEQAPEDDRYPLQPNIFHDTNRWVEGVDQRALPRHDMAKPLDVLVARQGHLGVLETLFAKLGRDKTDPDDSGWPW